MISTVKGRGAVLALIFLLSSLGVNAQLMEKLKQRAKEKGIETSDEVSYDITAYDPNMETGNEEGFEELDLESVQEFYDKDVVMALYDYEGRLVQTAYFDAETIAMRTEVNDSSTKPLYHDDKGKVYAYNDTDGQYENMTLLPSSSMGFMVAGLTTQVYKLPQEPYFEAYKALEDAGSGLNFLVLEMAFIYKPSHFKSDNYTPVKVACSRSSDCVRFSYNDPEYPGSYIQFDTQGRLNEFYINSTNEAFKDNPSGKFVFTYESCTVTLPDSVERSMMPGPLNKFLKLERGLEPWKHNKKDK